MFKFVAFSIFFFMVAGQPDAQRPIKMSDTLEIKHTAMDFSVEDLDNPAWNGAKSVEIATYWSGERAPKGRHFTARLLWSDKALYIRFEAEQAEPLVISASPDLTHKTMKLWDRDVCEIFIAPDAAKPNKYYEFEVAPSGEWVDVGLEVLPDKRLSDWDYASGMKSAARVTEGRVVSAIKMDWKAFGRTPKKGDAWLGNLFRCVGKDPTRGYLAWQPTMTHEPAFHVPSKFGKFVFVR